MNERIVPTKALLILFFFSVSLFAVENASSHSSDNSVVKKIEPPFWWAGFNDSHLQLLLYGDDIASNQVEIQHEVIKQFSVMPLENSNYVAIDLELNANHQATTFPIHLIKNGEKSVIHYELKKRAKDSADRRGFESKDVIYLITPDRYANGDPSNDSLPAYQDKLNREHYNGRHGGDLQGIIEHLDYIHDMGFTQIWLNPVLENAQEKVSYHGYSTTDYYKVDPRYGSNALYLELSQQAKQKGIGLIKDIILNHIGTGHWWMDDLPAKNWINHPDKYRETNHKREAINDIHSTDEDREKFASGWFVPSMPDLNQKHPILAQYLIQNSIWWIEYADLSGIRLDTYSYSDKAFLSEYTKRIMNEYPNFSMVGEEWTLSQPTIAYWQAGKERHDDYESCLDSLMDFPVQSALVKALNDEETWGTGWHELYAIIANDYIYADPDNLVVFPDNHDMDRIYTQLRHDIDKMKMAMVYFATTRGIPQIFYGTEILMSNPDNHEHGVIRSDFPGGWQGDETNAFTGENLDKDAKAFQQWLKRLLNWRKETSVLHDGQLIHYAPENSVYVNFRVSNETIVMIIYNKNNDETAIELSRFSSIFKRSWDEYSAVSPLSGKVVRLNETIEVPGKSATILEIIVAKE